jgi:hypothetical protein
MPKIKFMLVGQNFTSFLVTTPFDTVQQLEEWLCTIRNDKKFADDPIANLPPRSFANLIITEDDIEDIDLDEKTVMIEDPVWDDCHGTLMVDDNSSVFYSARKNNSKNWTLPYMLINGAN